jgi:hypothetical protein
MLSGAGSTIEDYNSNTHVYDIIDTTLRTIGASGVLELLADRNWTTDGAAITNDGQIELGGGELIATASGASLTNSKGAKLYGFGTVDAPQFTNSGTIEGFGRRGDARFQNGDFRDDGKGPNLGRFHARVRCEGFGRPDRLVYRQRRRTRAARPRWIYRSDQRLRHSRSRFERHDRGRRTLGLYRLQGERWKH